MELNQESESLGGFLRVEREKRNVSIEQVAYATRIGIKMLHALEVDDHNQLPSPTFVRGYLQAYGKFLKIDSNDLLGKYELLLSQSPDKREVQIRSHYLYVKERYQERKKLFLIIALCALTLVLAGVYGVLKSKRDAKKQLAQQMKLDQSLNRTNAIIAPPVVSVSGTVVTQPSIPATGAAPIAKPKTDAVKPPTVKPMDPVVDKKEEPKKTEPAIAPIAPVSALNPTPALPTAIKKEPEPTKEDPAKLVPTEKKKYNLLVRAEKDVWLKFQLDNGTIKELTLREGKTLMMRADSVIKIFSGNLNGLKAALNGKEVPTLTSTNRSLSVIIPEAETANYPLPLFPVTTAPSAPARASSIPASTPATKTPENAPAKKEAPVTTEPSAPQNQ